MAINFRAISSGAKQEFEAKQAAEKEKEESASRARAATVAAGKAFLDAKIIPLLDEARKAFLEDGVTLAINKNYDVQMYVSGNPSISFVLSKVVQKRFASSGVLEAKSPPVFIISDGDILIIKMAKEYGRNAELHLDNGSVNETDRLVQHAVEKATKSFYEAVTKISEMV